MKKLLSLGLGISTLTALVLLDAESALAILKHRWSFDEFNGTTVPDSVGGADATLQGGANVSNGSLILDGIDDYVTLPIGNTIDGTDDITIEAWFTWDNDAESERWSRIFDFGYSDNNRYVFFTPANDRIDSSTSLGTPRLAVTPTNAISEQQINATDTIPTGTETNATITIDANTDTGIMYINGTEVGRNENMTFASSDLGVTPNNYLGRSQFSSDPYFDGSISEFRIYDNALTAAQVNTNFQAGTNTVAVPFGPSADLGILILGGLYGASRLRKKLVANKVA